MNHRASELIRRDYHTSPMWTFFFPVFTRVSDGGEKVILYISSPAVVVYHSFSIFSSSIPVSLASEILADKR